MDNYNEILLLLMDFYNINSNYTDKDLEEFKKENSVLQDIDIDEIIHMLEEIGKYLESEVDMEEDEEIKEGNSLVIRKANFIENIVNKIRDANIRELTFKNIIDCIKNFNYKRIFARIYRFIKKCIKKGLPYVTEFFKFLMGKLIELMRKKPNLDKQVLLYKKVVQDDLDKARRKFNKAVDDDEKSKYGKYIFRLSQGDSVIPKLDFNSNVKVGILGMVYDIRILIVFLLINIGLLRYMTVEYGFVIRMGLIDIIDFIIFMALYCILPVTFFLTLYSLLVSRRIKKKVAGSLELRNFMWDEFPYGSGLTQAFYNIGKSNYSVANNLDDFDFGEMDLDEMERLIIGDEESNNPYSKEWKEIFEDLFSVKGDFTIPKIMEVNERTEVHVMNHKNIDFSKVKKKSNEIRQYLGKEIYQLIPDYDDDIRQIGVEIITKPIPSKYTIHDMPNPSNKSSVIIGLGIKGWVEWDLENPDSAHCLLVGGTGSGKSRLMFHLIKQFIEQDFLVLFGDYKKLTFGRYSKRGYRVATENIQIASILSDLHEEMMRRNELFLKEGVEKLSEYNKLHPDNPLPRIVFLIDEFATFSNDTEVFDGKGLSKDEENEGAYKDYENILRVGRSAGIHLLIALQDPLATSIGGETLKGKARNLFDYKICGRIPREEYSETVLGKGDTRASKINKFGRFYISETSKDTAYQIVSPLVDDNTVAYLTENTPLNKYSDYKIGSPIPKVDEIKAEVMEQCIDTDKQIHNTLEEKTAEDYL